MARSKSSCFKVICSGGGDSIDDDLKQPPVKGSVDKRGWSFRKRHTKNRVLSNTPTTEIPSPTRKDSLDATHLDFLAQRNPSISQKSSVLQWAEDIPPLPTSLNSKTSDSLPVKESAVKIDTLVSTGSAENIASFITSEDTSKSSKNLEESSAVIIQAAIRAYLARRELLKLKNIVKLQAAFRGHLERRKAIGTLRCVQAIVKMQALVRARSARFSSQESATKENMEVKHEKVIQSEGIKQSGSNSNIKSSSTEKFLSNGFARQLLESAPNRKQIHIKCDPSKADSAWKWLERWVSVSTSESAHTRNPVSVPVVREGEGVGSALPTEIVSNSASLKQNGTKETSKLESEENSFTYDADNFIFQACHPSNFPKSHTTCDLQHDAKECTEAHNTSMDVTSRMEVQLDATCQILPNSVSKSFEAGGEQPRGSMKRAASEQPETDSKKLEFRSRKARNPVFTAAQSKFEELSSLTGSETITSSQVVGIDTFSELSSLTGSETITSSRVVGINTFSSKAESETKKNELLQSEAETEKNELFQSEESVNTLEGRVHIAGSDCGTELSISSTLDSPNSSEAEVEFEHENDIVEKMTCESDNNGFVIQELDVSNDNSIVTSEPISSLPISQFDDAFETSASDMQVQMETQTIQPAYSPSLEESPAAAQETPSSVKGGCKRSKSGSNQSRRSLSTSKRSPSDPDHDSVGRRSVDQLPGRRRNSFGHDSSLPSYMQATESARAKALLTGSSPRSSPDVQDLRKRHSLPGANAKQVSPRIQRSLSQVQQAAKGHAANNQDRKWVG